MSNLQEVYTQEPQLQERLRILQEIQSLLGHPIGDVFNDDAPWESWLETFVEAVDRLKETGS